MGTGSGRRRAGGRPAIILRKYAKYLPILRRAEHVNLRNIAQFYDLHYCACDDLVIQELCVRETFRCDVVREGKSKKGMQRRRNKKKKRREGRHSKNRV